MFMSRAAVDRPGDPQARAADLDLRARPIELGPGRRPLDVEVGAEAQGIDRLAHDPLEVVHARQVDQRQAFFPGVGEAVPRRLEQLGRAARRVAQETGQELLDQGAPQGLGRLGVHHPLAGPADGEIAARFVEADAQQGQPFVAQQGEEAAVRHLFRFAARQNRRAMSDGEAPVLGQSLAGREVDPRQALRVQALDRVAADLGESDRHRGRP